MVLKYRAKKHQPPGAMMKRNYAGMKNAATVLGESISMCVVPLRLRHCNSQEVKTFALLD